MRWTKTMNVCIGPGSKCSLGLRFLCGYRCPLVSPDTLSEPSVVSVGSTVSTVSGELADISDVAVSKVSVGVVTPTVIVFSGTACAVVSITSSSTTLVRKWSWWQCLCLPCSIWTWYDTGPEISATLPGSHCGPEPKFFTYTNSPLPNECAMTFWLCCRFWVCCLSSTPSAAFGRSRSRHVWGCRPKSSSAGDIPVVISGIVRYMKRTFARWVFIVPTFTYFKPFLSIWTSRSASLFEAGWYGAEVVCFIPLILRIALNSWLVRPVPSLVTMVSGKPNLAKSVTPQWQLLMMWQLVSINLEWVSMATRMVFPWKGPAKSRCSLAHGLVGHF